MVIGSFRESSIIRAISILGFGETTGTNILDAAFAFRGPEKPSQVYDNISFYFHLHKRKTLSERQKPNPCTHV